MLQHYAASNKHTFCFLTKLKQNANLLISERSIAQYTTLKETAMAGLNHHKCYHPFAFHLLQSSSVYINSCSYSTDKQWTCTVLSLGLDCF